MEEKKRDRKKITIIWILAAVAILFLCFFLLQPGKTGNTAVSGNARGKKRMLFGATYMTMNNPYFTALNSRLQETVEANGDLLIARDPAQDQGKQNEQIQDMLNEGIGLLFLNPADWKTVKPALDACKAAGIPIIDIDTPVYDGEYVVSSIVSDNYGAGVQCAEDLISKRSSGNILVLDSPAQDSINSRVNGFIDTLKGHPEFKITDIKHGMGELEVSMQVTSELLKKGEYFDIVFGGNDPTALGALAAFQKAGISRNILVYGVDGSPDVKAAIKEGIVEGTSAQRPLEIASKAAQIAFDYLNGKEIEKNVIIPVTMITKDNIEQFDISGWQ